jgi:hypothetical protein
MANKSRHSWHQIAERPTCSMIHSLPCQNVIKDIYPMTYIIYSQHKLCCCVCVTSFSLVIRTGFVLSLIVAYSCSAVCSLQWLHGTCSSISNFESSIWDDCEMLMLPSAIHSFKCNLPDAANEGIHTNTIGTSDNFTYLLVPQVGQTFCSKHPVT